MKSIYKYFLIYQEFFKTSLSTELSFRSNFILQCLRNVSFISAFFFTPFFIFNHIDHIGPWNKTEFLLFVSFALAVDQTHYLFILANFWRFSEDIRLGNLDFHLLKPAHSLFIVLFRKLAIPGVFTVLLTYSFVIYFGVQLNLSFLGWFSLPFCLLLSLVLLLGIEVLICLFNFFTIEGDGLNHAILQTGELSRWPDFIYRTPARLWLLPFLAVNSIPVRWILDHSYWSWLVGMVFGTIFLWSLILLFFWPKALTFYESPSS